MARLELNEDGFVVVKTPTTLPFDSLAPDVVGVTVSKDGKRLWVCINGQCVLRVKDAKTAIDVERLQ